MPELVETKIICRKITVHVLNKKIRSFRFFDQRIFAGKKPNINKLIIGSCFKKIDPLGRTLLFKLSSGHFLFADLHTKGRFEYIKTLPTNQKLSQTKYLKAFFEFTDGSGLIFTNPSSSGRFRLLSDPARQRFIYHNFGFDLLKDRLTYQKFLELLKNRRSSVKNFLINPKVFQGIGPVYSDEVCFSARIRPDRKVNSFREVEKKRLFKALLKIPARSLAHGGLSLYLPTKYQSKTGYDHFLQVYDRTDKKCLVCKVGQIKLAQKNRQKFFFCPQCQKLPQTRMQRHSIIKEL